MVAFPNYAVGTVSIGAGATTVVGSGTLWTGVNARPGDTLIVAGHQVIIEDVTDATDLVIDAWPFTAVVAAAYKIIQNSPLRFAGGQAMADVSAMIAALNTDGWYRYVAPSYSDPTAQGLTAGDGQFAFQASTGKLWIMTGGAWSFIGVYKGLQFKGAWSAVVAYTSGDVVSLAGSSYICTASNTNQTPPNATYWQVLAAKGDTGATALLPIAVWATTTAYVVGPPASYVSINGSSYQCLVAHTSGVFATDLAAGKWGLVAQAGVNAPTYGGTSTTSLTIGTGAKAFTTQAGLAYQNGARIRASSNATPTNWMEGVSTYAGTTLTITVDKTNGAATAADWNFDLAGQPGAGDLSAANNLSDVLNAVTALANLGGAKGFGLQAFTASGTYTPTAGMKYALVIATGGGGGGGGADGADATSSNAGSGGAGGGTCILLATAATIGASKAVTIGAGGTAGSGTGGTNGSAGGDTTLGTLFTATGGGGGTGAASASYGWGFLAGAGGVPTGGLVNITGGDGDLGRLGYYPATPEAWPEGGKGGASFWGGWVAGPSANSSATSTAGNAGKAYGSGGSGGVCLNTTNGSGGGAGKSGFMLILEIF